MAVEDIINEARDYAATSLAEALPLVQAAQTAISSWGTFGVFGGPTVPPLENIEIDAEIPELEVPELDVPDAPEAPGDYAPLPALDVGTAPDIDAIAPTFLEPERPANLRDFAVSAPSITTEFAFPEPPEQLQDINFLPPELADRAEPEEPELQIPVFEATDPGSAPTAPTNLRATLATAYETAAPAMRTALGTELDDFLARINPQFHTQMAALEAKLTRYLEGGTALDPTIENAIFERGRGKVTAEFRRAIDTAADAAAGRGMTIPDGAMNSAIRQLRQGAGDANARAAVDIAVKQAELEQQNTQFAITTSATLRQAVLSAALSYHGNLVTLNGQALTYAQALLTAVIETYNLEVRAFTARLELYRAQAQVYETRMRAVQALVDMYRARVEALRALTDVDLARVKVYEARLQSLQVLASVYRTQVETVVQRASLEKLKIDLFGAQVQQYEAESRGKSAEWQAYSAAIGGQEARIRAFEAEIRAQGERVRAFGITVDAKRAQIQTVTDYNRGLTDRYVAEVQGFRALVDAQGSINSSLLDLQRVQLAAVAARLGAQETQARVNLEYHRANASTTLEVFKTQTLTLLENAKLNLAQIKATADVALAGAGVYKGLAEAALSGINTLVSESLSR